MASGDRDELLRNAAWSLPEPTPAFAALRAHAALVRRNLETAGFASVVVKVLANGLTSDPLVAVTART